MVTKDRPKLKDGPRVPKKKVRLEDRCKNCHSLFMYYRNKKKKISAQSFCNVTCRKQFSRDRSIVKNFRIFGPYEKDYPTLKELLSNDIKRAKNHIREVHHVTNGIKAYCDTLILGRSYWDNAKQKYVNDWDIAKEKRKKEAIWHYKN